MAAFLRLIGMPPSFSMIALFNRKTLYLVKTTPMKRTLLTISIAPLFFLSLISVPARPAVPAAPRFKLSINSGTGIYDKDAKAVISCDLTAPVTDTLHVRIYKNNQLQEEKSIAPAVKTSGGWEIPGSITLFEGSYNETCAVYAEVTEGGNSLTSQGIGFVVAPEGFQTGYSEPEDMMSWWNGQKKQLAKMPMNLKLTELDVPEQYRGRFSCQDVTADCLGPAPMRAYFAKPVGAGRKSLPIIILCRAAGVAGDWCRCQVGECVGNAALGGGALSLDLNAHGMENGRPLEYYRELENGPLKNYWDQGIADKETYYFRGMYLRVLRAIQFMTSQPEWDGKRIIIIGESQGGGQAAAAAGLDPRVSAVVLNVPAMIDFGGANTGRRGGWPQPVESHQEISAGVRDAVLPYFDAGLLLKHSKAEIYCEIGLIDTTCPPSAVWAGLNNAPGPKTIRCVPFRSHSWPSGEIRPYWEENYLHPREDFYRDYLK